MREGRYYASPFKLQNLIGLLRVGKKKCGYSLAMLHKQTGSVIAIEDNKGPLQPSIGTRDDQRRCGTSCENVILPFLPGQTGIPDFTDSQDNLVMRNDSHARGVVSHTIRKCKPLTQIKGRFECPQGDVEGANGLCWQAFNGIGPIWLEKTVSDAVAGSTVA